MDIRYIDAHCHLQFEQYDDDREEIIEQMGAQGVAGVVVGCDLESSRKAVELAQMHEHLYASVGVHPTDTGEFFDTDELLALAKHPKVVAIGECGLDFFRPTLVDESEKARQKLTFSRQVVLAAEQGLPLIIHARPSKGTMDAYHDVLELLTEAKKTYPDLRGDVHFFVGGISEAEAFVAIGFTVSFTAVTTFARDYDEVIRTVPLTSILAETDSPYVAPLARRGKRNDPLAVIDVAEKIAEVRGEDPEAVRIALLANTKSLFGL
ncbi:MAG TPA: TatD family hydrolase [Candidatus Paceibacterota bacterium]|nr:TatD family hydrolase [Candidatus Paceibacterota bacterium]